MYKNPMEQYLSQRLAPEGGTLKEFAQKHIGRDVADSLPEEPHPAKPPTATLEQVGGTHYKMLPIQPFRYIHANSIPFAEGCVIKYVTRWRSKGGLDDLRKARHMLDLLIEAEDK